MERNIFTLNKNKWLLNEIVSWESEKIITPEQSRILAEKYRASQTWTNYLFPVLGSLLVGIGIILFFASNWEALPIWFKLGLIFAALIVSHLFGYHFRYKSQQPWLGSGLLLLGGILFGAAIFLIAQIYNISSGSPVPVLCWGIGVLLETLVLKEKPLLILSGLLLSVWAFMQLSSYQNTVPWLYFVFTLLIMVPLSYRIDSIVGLFISVVGTIIVTVVSAANLGLDSPVPLFILATALSSACFIRGQDSTDRMAGTYYILGLLFTLGCLFALTFHDLYDKTIFSSSDLSVIMLHPRIVLAVLLLAVLASIGLISHRPRFREALNSLGLIWLINFILLIFVLIPINRSVITDPIMPIVMNLVLFFSVIFILWLGNKHQNRFVLNSGLVFFYLQVISRYFDFAYSYMDRSIFFIVGGVLLVILGIILNRQRARMVTNWGDENA
ncbi:MAG: DUF2157 domain-containing protein [Chitinophagales bacterium]